MESIQNGVLRGNKPMPAPGAGRRGTLKELLTEIWPLHRSLVSDGTDEALEILRRNFPKEGEYAVETYAPGKEVWTWRVPPRYVVHEAYLMGEDGRRIVDFKDNPLHLVSYSQPVDALLTWEELEPHLHFSAKRPNAIPWVATYYKPGWGLCLPKALFDRLPRDKRYRAVIRSEFVTDPEQGLRVGVGLLHPEGGAVPSAGEMILCSHICHPHQANDDVSGVVTAVGVARALAQRPLPAGSMSVRFLFVPETIGSICYLSHHEEIIPRLRGGIFCEMTGNRDSLHLKRSRQGDHLLDRVARAVLKRRVGEFRECSFLHQIRNDDMVINGPGVNAPCIQIGRWPYDEYHTSDDNPGIIHEEMLAGAAGAAEEIVRIYAANFIPRRKFRGPIFLTRYGLFVDWQEDPKICVAMQEIMLRMEGKHSVFDIAEELDLDYWETRKRILRMAGHGLVDVGAIPRLPMDG